MPEISRFYGIVVRMYFDDHNPPHFHARYAGSEALVDIRNLVVIAGSLPTRASGMAVEWASLHQDELLDLWERAKRSEPLHRVEPLP